MLVDLRTRTYDGPPRWLRPSADPRRGRRLLKAALFGVGFVVPITAIAFLVRESFDPLIHLDQRAITATTDITRERPWLRTALIVWQEATQPRNLYVVGTIVTAVVALRKPRMRGRCVWAFATMMVAWALQLAIKEIVQRARPILDDPVSHAPGYSFPSGHTANAAAFAAVMTVLLWPLLGARVRAVLLGSAITFSLLTALDRVFLGVHFPSDVTAGLIFGVGLTLASYAGYLGWSPMQPNDPVPTEVATGPHGPAST